MTQKKRDGERDEKLTLAIVEALKNKGRTQSDIAREYGVTRQHVSWIVKTYGGTQTPRQKLLEHFPWEVPSKQLASSPYRNMRNHAEYMATGGVGMGAPELKRLRNFYQKLQDENLVLEFDPNIPGEPGFAINGGFALRPREESDGDLMIRVNEYTKLSDEGKRLWRFPRCYLKYRGASGLRGLTADFEINVESDAFPGKHYLHASREGNTMIVVRSPLVADDDPWLEQVREVLAGTSHVVSEEYEEMDEHFMFNRKRTTVYGLEDFES
ncbi:hypothetical protein [Rhodococcus phage RGL3]|uniref:Uncharacterized protein n=1 Tax=Rhodococcus phage RGL3 TaxID=2922221 RepID=G9FHP2_9CAUD|nr:transcriptional repressor [Rhodococcus phage RGL3]AEV52130.1 hypothetical protein [Rhodococcus phage RGL3]